MKKIEWTVGMVFCDNKYFFNAKGNVPVKLLLNL